MCQVEHKTLLTYFVLWQRHPDGIITVTFRQPEEADVCIAAVHRRWFDGRTLEAEAWDGRTKYTVKESMEEMEQRLSKWHSYIEGDSGKIEGNGNSGGQSQASAKAASDRIADTSNSALKSEDSALKSEDSALKSEDSAVNNSSSDVNAV